MGSLDMMRSPMGLNQQQLMQPRMDMMAERQMSPLRMSPMMRNMYSTDQAMGPNQRFLQDKFGNYAYAYANQNSEKMEEGNQNSVKGHYAYIMSNGQRRRVDYVADNQGFHVIRDDARIKRSAEPDLMQTKMTSIMDSSSLRDDSLNMYNMMSPNTMMYRNRLGMMTNQNMLNRNMMGQDMSMMDQMMGRDMMMGQDMSNSQMMRQNMYGNMMDRDMSNNMMNLQRNMMRMPTNQMMGQNMYTNMMDRDMSGNQVMRQDMYRMGQGMNNELMGQSRNVMGQRMEIEQIPSNRLF